MGEMAPPETAWAGFCTDGHPYPFINIYSVRATRREAQAHIGNAWRREGETVEQGWKRAYRNGWRAIRVEVRPVRPAQKDEAE